MRVPKISTYLYFKAKCLLLLHDNLGITKIFHIEIVLHLVFYQVIYFKSTSKTSICPFLISQCSKFNTI